MTTNAPISVTSPADILSYVPHVLGFQPTESLVLLTMSGKRVGATLRLDLPSGASDPLEYAQTVRGYLKSDSSADGVLMILYTAQDWSTPADPPFAGLVHCLDLILDAAGLALLDGWFVGPGYWRDYFCEDAGCCPWPGHSLTQITESVLNAELVYQGSSYADSLDDAVETPAAENNALVRAAIDEHLQQWGGSWDVSTLGRDCLTLWDGLISHPAQRNTVEADPEVLAFMLAGLSCAAVRDTLIVLAATDLHSANAAAVECGVFLEQPAAQPLPPACTAAMARFAALTPRQGDDDQFVTPAVGADALFRQVFLAIGQAPDWERMDAAYSVFRRMTAVATGQSRSALLSILGWLEWARGRGSRAHRYLQEALEETPGYTLAELLLALVGTGSLAPWARQRETAWTSGSRTAA